MLEKFLILVGIITVLLIGYAGYRLWDYQPRLSFALAALLAGLIWIVTRKRTD
jgi:hypothetical protein